VVDRDRAPAATRARDLQGDLTTFEYTDRAGAEVDLAGAVAIADRHRGLRHTPEADPGRIAQHDLKALVARRDAIVLNGNRQGLAGFAVVEGKRAGLSGVIDAGHA